MTIIINYITPVAPVAPLSGMNYGLLKAAIANRLGRANLAAIIPSLCALAEARIYHGFRDIEVQVAPLRIAAMIAVETVSLATLPARYLETSRFTVPGSPSPRALSYLTPEQFASLPASGIARHYTFQDGGIKVEGGAPSEFTFSYYRRFAPLVADADTNWLLDNHPAIYLYSALIEAYAHAKDDARIPTATRMYAAAVNGLIESEMSARYSGSTLSMPSAR